MVMTSIKENQKLFKKKKNNVNRLYTITIRKKKGIYFIITNQLLRV